MATVYVATDLRLERRVALKVMHDHLAADDAFRARFIQEARAAAKIAHPNVVNVFDQGEDRGLAYIAMEYVPGINLRDLLLDHHRLTPEQAIDVMDAVLSGLQVAHRHGIIHRDLKPENVLLADDGRIKLSDFGLARAASANTASGSVLLGTIAYLSPELVTQGHADIRSDIYALGIMLFEMLTGKQPYTGDQPVNIAFRHANEDVPPPSRIQPGIPTQLDDLVIWATERDPEARPADAGAMLVALRQAEREISAGVGTHPVANPELTQPHPVTARTVTATGDAPSHPAPHHGSQTSAGYLPPLATDGYDRPAPPAGYDSMSDLTPRGGLEGLGFADTDEVHTDPIHQPAPPAAPAPGGWGAPASAPPGAFPAAPANLGHGASASGLRARRRRRLLPAVIALCLILFAVIAGAAWWTTAGPGSYRAVPNVIGLTREEATGLIEHEGFTIDRVEEQHSDTVEAGRILSADPTPGANVAPNTRISMVVSSGREMVNIPDVAGKPRDAAVQAMQGAKLTVNDTAEQREFSDTAAEGTVMRVTGADGKPASGQVTVGTEIRFVVSAGSVPNVVGKTVDQARDILKKAGLTLQESSSSYSDTVPKGSIISYRYFGEPVKPGDKVGVEVSKGPELIQVPNVVGKSTREAVDTLKKAGFTVNGTISDAVLDLSRVTATDPPAGSMQKKGTAIKVTTAVVI